MNTRRNSSYSASVFALVSLLSSSCGGEETYADQHIDAIEFDCTNTAPCDPLFSVRPDPLEECIKDTSMKLNGGSDAFRAMYDQRTTRCSMYSGCQYFACARDTMLFSVTRENLLRYECQQTSLCKIQSGQQTAPNENDLCFAALAQQLDFAPIADRATWEQKAGRCNTMQACAYVNCR